MKQPRHLAIADELIADDLVVSHFQVHPLTDLLKGVTERTMPQIVNERRGQGVQAPLMLWFKFANDSHELAGGMKDTKTVREPGVRCSRVNEVREPELLYAPKPLKRTGLNYAPQHALQLRPTDIEFDEIM